MSKRRVVVTGMGIVSPLGNDLASNWDAICNGRSGIGPVTGFDAATFATRIAAIEALKASHRRALAALDALFASLQQRAIAGQL